MLKGNCGWRLAVLAGAVVALVLRSLGASVAASTSNPDVEDEEDRPKIRHQLSFHGCSEYNATGRCLPNFLVLGVQKAGTSTLFQLMRTHPQILEPAKKELHFFFHLEPRFALWFIPR